MQPSSEDENVKENRGQPRDSYKQIQTIDFLSTLLLEGSEQKSKTSKKTKSILFCTDYHRDSLSAYEVLKGLCKAKPIRLHILHILPSLHRYMPTETIVDYKTGEVDYASNYEQEKALRRLRQTYPHPEGQPGKYQYQVSIGTAYVEILRYAKKYPIDLIVMGAKGGSRFGQTHYGSTVSQVIKRTRAPVVAIQTPGSVKLVHPGHKKESP